MNLWYIHHVGHAHTHMHKISITTTGPRLRLPSAFTYQEYCSGISCRYTTFQHDTKMALYHTHTHAHTHIHHVGHAHTHMHKISITTTGPRLRLPSAFTYQEYCSGISCRYTTFQHDTKMALYRGRSDAL